MVFSGRLKVPAFLRELFFFMRWAIEIKNFADFHTILKYIKIIKFKLYFVTTKVFPTTRLIVILHFSFELTVLLLFVLLIATLVESGEFHRTQF